MKNVFDINVSRSEAIRRYVLGAALIGAVLISPAVPSWIALFACYPIFTAMLQWDPMNALFQPMVANLSETAKDAFFRKSTTSL